MIVNPILKFYTYRNATTPALCNAHCGCAAEVYHPVCDRSSGLTYMSPCHAGCVAAETQDANGEVSVSQTRYICF